MDNKLEEHSNKVQPRIFKHAQVNDHLSDYSILVEVGSSSRSQLNLKETTALCGKSLGAGR
jgi:hypothetical protein